MKSGPRAMHSPGRTDRRIVTLFSKISTSSFFFNDRVTLQALRTNMLKLQSVRAVWKLYQQCHHVIRCHLFCPITHEVLGVATWYLQCVDDDSTCNNSRPSFVAFEIGEISPTGDQQRYILSYLTLCKVSKLGTYSILDDPELNYVFLGNS